MKKWFQIALGVVFVGLWGQTVLAGGAGLTAKIGTLGYGADLTLGLVPSINLRVGFNTISLDLDVGDDEGGTSGAADIESELDWMTLTGWLDWHPTKGSFRLTAGVVVNNNEVKLSANVSESVEINDRAYTVLDLSGKVTFNDIAPYFGIGFGNAVGKDGRWHFALDLGVLLQGSPEVTLEARSPIPALQAILDRDLDAEAQEFEDDTESFDMYPVLSIGASRTF